MVRRHANATFKTANVAYLLLNGCPSVDCDGIDRKRAIGKGLSALATAAATGRIEVQCSHGGTDPCLR